METIIYAQLSNDDESPALAEVVANARWRSARVIAVSTQGDAGGTPVFSSPEAQSEIAQALAAAGVEHEMVFAQDNAPEQILALAQEHSASLIVLGIRKRSPLLKLFLGSAAQQVILEAECPVLTVRAG